MGFLSKSCGFKSSEFLSHRALAQFMMAQLLDMGRTTTVIKTILLGLLIWCGVPGTEHVWAQTAAGSNMQTFNARGVILEIKPNHIVVIRHEAISNYMAAMTMPFPVKDPSALAGLERGDEVMFRLHVTDTESWVDHFTKISKVALPSEPQPPKMSAANSEKWLLDYKFTNELGQAVSFNDFRGQALAITFFYTRCPLPDYCPRLSKNFQEASEKLQQMTNMPANWHLISVTFDPEFDTPAVLKNYGEDYHYDPTHWSFLTGPPDKIAEFAHASGVEFEADGGTINHNFRTLIVNPQGHLQTIFPVSGDLSEQIVSEIIKAMTSNSAR
jgi:protein SCO1/2